MSRGSPSPGPDLAEVERAFARICFDLEPREADLALLHADEERWLLYRRMVRSRLFRMARSGLPKTSRLLGEACFDAAVADYLAQRGPRSRFIRDIVHELVEHALPRWEADPGLPAHVPDLVRLEQAKWRVGSAEWEEREHVELDFEAPCVMNPTVATAPLRHRVDKDFERPEALERPHLAVVYRPPGSARIHTYVLNDIGGRLFQAWQRPDRSFAEGARAVLAELDRQPDPRFVDGMATVLASLVEKEIVLGSRPS